MLPPPSDRAFDPQHALTFPLQIESAEQKRAEILRQALLAFNSDSHRSIFRPLQIDSAEQKRAEILRQADVRCLDAAAKFAGLLGPLQLVEQGMGMVSAALCCAFCCGWAVDADAALRMLCCACGSSYL